MFLIRRRARGGLSPGQIDPTAFRHTEPRPPSPLRRVPPRPDRPVVCPGFGFDKYENESVSTALAATPEEKKLLPSFYLGDGKPCSNGSSCVYSHKKDVIDKAKKEPGGLETRT